MAWRLWQAALAADRAWERQRWASLRLNFGPGDYEGVWGLEDALELLDPNDPEDGPALLEVPRYFARQHDMQWRARMQDAAARVEEEVWHRRRRARRQQAQRLRRTERELYVELSTECVRRPRSTSSPSRSAARSPRAVRCRACASCSQ